MGVWLACSMWSPDRAPSLRPHVPSPRSRSTPVHLNARIGQRAESFDGELIGLDETPSVAVVLSRHAASPAEAILSTGRTAGSGPQEQDDSACEDDSRPVKPTTIRKTRATLAGPDVTMATRRRTPCPARAVRPRQYLRYALDVTEASPV